MGGGLGATSIGPKGISVKTYIALIRGINVGGKNSLPMKELAAIFQSQCCKNVKTYIQSGNVVFQSQKKLGTKDSQNIGKAILKTKGFKPIVMILSKEELRSAIEANPFPTNKGKALHIFFLEAQPKEPNLERLLSLKSESEKFELGKLVFYLFAPDSMGRSKLASAVEKSLGVAVTARNWNTVNELASMVKGV